MTFAELFSTLESRGVFKKRAHAYKSALLHLARALGSPTLEQCPVEGACRDPSQWLETLNTYFATRRTGGKTMTANNCDNIRTDLRSLFRFAEAQGLLTAPLPVRLLTPTDTLEAYRSQRRGSSPYQDTYSRKAPYRLPQPQWPTSIALGWQGYLDILGRRPEGPLREVTLRKNAYALETYFGYLDHVYEKGTYTPTWDDLFCVDLLRAFVQWHGARLGREAQSAHGTMTVRTAVAIANVVQLDQSLPPDQSRHPPLVAYARRLKLPAPLHNKERYHWAELPRIEAVANSLLAEGRIPAIGKTGALHTGRRRAARFQLGLILKLLTRVPLRQRNVRELQWPKHLWKDRAGHWTLRFAGRELKVAMRKGEVNVFQVRLSQLYPKDGPTPDDFIPTLEEFLTDHRPLLLNADTSPSLFLTQRGVPFSGLSLHREIVTAMHRRAGVRLNPHMIRDIAATTLLNKTKDYDMVAALLGNTVAMVMKHYAHLIPEQQIALATGHLSQVLRTG